jgi:nonsense-mediated mRNA decay protein 3
MKNMGNIKLVKKSSDMETATIISKSPQFLQILDPIDYSAVDLNMKDEYDSLNVGQEVKLIRIDNNIYLMI